MPRLILYIASSINGKIAASDGSVDWLESIPNPDKLDYGYEDFYDSIDTTIQGFNTYQQIRDWGIEFPYIGKKNYVLTTRSSHQAYEHVEFISKDHIPFIRNLKNKSGGDIWLIGGGQVIALLLEEKLIDEIQLFVMPIVLSEGIDLVYKMDSDQMLKLHKVDSYPNGAVRLIYRKS